MKGERRRAVTVYSDPLRVWRHPTGFGKRFGELQETRMIQTENGGGQILHLPHGFRVVEIWGGNGLLKVAKGVRGGMEPDVGFRRMLAEEFLNGHGFGPAAWLGTVVGRD